MKRITHWITAVAVLGTCGWALAEELKPFLKGVDKIVLTEYGCTNRKVELTDPKAIQDFVALVAQCKPCKVTEVCEAMPEGEFVLWNRGRSLRVDYSSHNLFVQNNKKGAVPRVVEHFLSSEGLLKHCFGLLHPKEP